MQWFFPLLRRTVPTDVTCACVVVSRAARIETGNIEDNAADFTCLGNDFFGLLLCEGTPMTVSKDFHISTTAILAQGTIKHNYDLSFILT